MDDCKLACFERKCSLCRKRARHD